MIIATATTTCTFTGIIPENNLPVSAAEEVMKTDDGFQYEVNNNGEVTITKYIGTDTDVDIPSKIDGKPVTSIGEYAFYNYNDLISVTILDSVISIGAHAFDHCENLESIKIPNSVTTIKEYTFSYCGPLEITIPRSVTTIEDNAFNYCWATIYGYKDSYAETFAQNSSFEFKEIQESEQTLGITSFTADKVSPQKVGTAVTLTTDATVEGLQYKYYKYLNGKYELIKDWSSSSSITISPSAAGKYDLYVGVKDRTTA